MLVFLLMISQVSSLRRRDREGTAFYPCTCIVGSFPSPWINTWNQPLHCTAWTWVLLELTLQHLFLSLQRKRWACAKLQCWAMALGTITHPTFWRFPLHRMEHVSCLVLPCLVLPCLALLCLALPCLDWSDLFSSCLVLSCHVSSCLVLSFYVSNFRFGKCLSKWIAMTVGCIWFWLLSTFFYQGTFLALVMG